MKLPPRVEGWIISILICVVLWCVIGLVATCLYQIFHR